MVAASPTRDARFPKNRHDAIMLAHIPPSEAWKSAIIAVRSACDMYIYYRWIPQWNPPEFWMYSAGVVSAVLGIYLIWDESCADELKRQQIAAVPA